MISYHSFHSLLPWPVVCKETSASGLIIVIRWEFNSSAFVGCRTILNQNKSQVMNFQSPLVNSSKQSSSEEWRDRSCELNQLYHCCVRNEISVLLTTQTANLLYLDEKLKRFSTLEFISAKRCSLVQGISCTVATSDKQMKIPFYQRRHSVKNLVHQ